MFAIGASEAERSPRRAVLEALVKAGASLVQLYSALIYQGPGLIERIKADLADKLTADGYAYFADAVGADAENT